MKASNIQIISKYEVKLLTRSWLFRIFSILALLGITGFLLWKMTPLINPYDSQWQRQAISSQIPFYSTIFYNIAQTIIMIFLSNSFLKRDKKLDTAEVIYVRPMSNSDYIIGKTWGIIKVFLSLQVITLLITASIHLLLTESPFSIFPYFFYILAISIPSTLFILGLSYIITCFFKNQAITFLIMLGIMGVEFFYIKDACYGIFDFFGAFIPCGFSDVTGNPHIWLYLLQRFIFLAAGIGFIAITTALIKRLPHKAWKTKLLYASGFSALLISVTAGWLYIQHHRNMLQKRQQYIEVFNAYASEKYANTISNDLTIAVADDQLKGESKLLLENHNEEDLSKIILYLNPTLQISGIKMDGQSVDFQRDRQVVIISKQLKSGCKTSLQIVYDGEIDESICYTDIEEDEYIDDTELQQEFPIGKKYVWLSDKFTLLTPECIWYPVTIPSVNPKATYNLMKDFTRYSLTVSNPAGKTVLSQGTMIPKGQTVTFTNNIDLPCISLTIADYEHKSIQVDSVCYDIMYFQGHDFFSKWFNGIQDTLPGLIRDIKNDIELKKGRDYPFRKFVMAETPAQHYSYIRNWKGYTEYILPEIVFIPERAIRLNTDFRATKFIQESWKKRYNGESSEEEISMAILNKFIQNTFLHEDTRNKKKWNEKYINKFLANALLYHHVSYIHSGHYPILDIALHTMQCGNENRNAFAWGSIINDQQRANLYLEDHSFQQATEDTELKPKVFYELLKLKSKSVKNYMTTIISEKEFNDYLKDFYKRNQFKVIPVEKLLQDLDSRLGIDMRPFLEDWYHENFSPTLFIRDVDADQTIVEDKTKYQVRFKVYNSSDVNAIISAEISENDGKHRGHGRKRGRNFNRPSNETLIENYVIEARKAYEIKMITDNRPSSIRINTNISHNLPALHLHSFSKIKTETQDTLAGKFEIDIQNFANNPNEIIIDNESSGFKTIASNNRHKLKDLLQKEEKEKYKNFTPWYLPSKWTTFAAEYCYGQTNLSAVYKRKGSGKNAVEWTTDIKTEGYYDISIWNPKATISWGMMENQMQSERQQTYTVFYNNDKEEITIDLGQEDSGWVSMGSFYLPEGITKIVLTDKTNGKFVMADAIKFTKID